MSEETKARAPDYVGRIDVPMWKNVDKNGKTYFSIKVFGETVNLFENTPRKQEPTETAQSLFDKHTSGLLTVEEYQTELRKLATNHKI